MANTYSQIYIQIVFAVESRQNLIDPAHNDELQKYITGIITAQRHKLIVINNVPDHAHILIGQRPDSNLSELVGDMKSGSTKLHQPKSLGKGQVQLAGGFWRLLLFSFTVRQCNQIHSEPAETSPEALLS
jgi:putative transposase